MRRLLGALVLLLLACEGVATRATPSFPASATPMPMPTAAIDVTDMMGAFPATTFYVVADDGVKAVALLNHNVRFTVATKGAVQVAAGNGQLYVADEVGDDTRLRWIEKTTGKELASWIERGRTLTYTRSGHGSFVVEPSTGRPLAMYSEGSRRVVEAYEPYTMRPLGRRLESGCGDRLLAAADRVVVPCYAAGTFVVKDVREQRTVDSGLGEITAAALSSDGTLLAGRADGTLARIPLLSGSGVEKIEPFRPAKLVGDGIAAADAQTFAIALATSDTVIAISDIRGGRRYISFPVKSQPVGGLLAFAQFAYWSNGSEAKHIDLYQGFAETMSTFSGKILPGAVAGD